MKRLLIISPSMLRGGAEAVALTLARQFRARGWDVQAAFDPAEGNTSLIRDHQAADIPYHPLIIGELGLWRGRPLVRAWRTGRLLRRLRPDAVQLHLGWPDMGYGPLLSCAAVRMPTEVIFHSLGPEGSPPPRRRRRYHWVAARRQAWVCVADASRHTVARYFSMDAGRFQVIRNGIEPPPVDQNVAPVRAAVRAELSLPPHALLLLTVARIDAMKGYGELAQAAAHVVGTHPNVRFLWIGQGNARGEVERRVAECGVSDRVLMPGQRSDVARLMAASDLLVFPSHSEACPLVVLEAMAAGLPILASRLPSTAELAEENVHALFCRPKDSADLLEKLRWALANPEAMRTMAVKAREHARQFTVQRMVDGHEAVLNGLMAARQH